MVKYDEGGYYALRNIPTGYYYCTNASLDEWSPEIRIPYSTRTSTPLYQDGYNDGFNKGVNDVKANPSNYGLSNSSHTINVETSAERGSSYVICTLRVVIDGVEVFNNSNERPSGDRYSGCSYNGTIG